MSARARERDRDRENESRLFFSRPGTSIVFISRVIWEDLFWNNVAHINDLYYMPEDSEVYVYVCVRVCVCV